MNENLKHKHNDSYYTSNQINNKNSMQMIQTQLHWTFSYLFDCKKFLVNIDFKPVIHQSRWLEDSNLLVNCVNEIKVFREIHNFAFSLHRLFANLMKKLVLIFLVSIDDINVASQIRFLFCWTEWGVEICDGAVEEFYP